MSDLDASAHTDPLRALRAQDHRPTSEVWRSRLRDWLTRRRSGDAPLVRPWLFGALAIPVVLVVGWQSYVATDPPIESSLPLASEVGPLTSADVAVPVGADVAGDAPVATNAPSGMVVVHVAGAVLRPGLIIGEPGWRMNDAVLAAGGPAADADLDRVNLAAPLVDGERLFIPEVGEEAPEVVTSADSDSGTSERVAVDVNTADRTELESLPGIGPVTASAIVDHRSTHGAFATVDNLVAVRGIGAATVDQLRDHVRVGR